MQFNLPSEIASLIFLSLLLAASASIAVRSDRRPMADILAPACLALALQALHVGEEFAAGFYIQAPAMFGLPPWSPSFFVWINVVALSVWLLTLREIAVGRASALSAAWLWFLALSSVGNAIWHTAGSLFIGGYFPGTVTAPFLGVAGWLLLRQLRARPAAFPS